MKRILKIFPAAAILAAAATLAATPEPTLEQRLGLCQMSDGVRLDLKCVGRNLATIHDTLSEIQRKVELIDQSKTVSDKLPKLIAAGREYAQQYCGAFVEMMRGQFESCMVAEQVELIRHVSCVAAFPIRHDEYSEALEANCQAPRSAR
jgi:hypothetical protein